MLAYGGSSSLMPKPKNDDMPGGKGAAIRMDVDQYLAAKKKTKKDK